MSDTSTKRAEEVAYNLQLSGVSGSTWRATEVDASNILRALAAERDALRAALQTARRNALKEAAKRAAHYERMAYHHGNLPVDDPHECAAQVAREIEASIRALGEKE